MDKPTRIVRRRPTSLRIGTIMNVVVVAALVGWLARNDPKDTKTPVWLCFGCCGFLVANLWVRSITSRRCPACKENRVGRVGIPSRRFSYHRCDGCGQRLKRGVFGGFWDASGKEDDAHFAPRNRPVQTWDRDPIVPDLTSPATRTVSSLLRTKLDRSAMVEEAIAHGESPLEVLDPKGRAKPRSKPRLSAGVQLRLSAAFSRTLDLLRCARSSPSSSSR